VFATVLLGHTVRNPVYATFSVAVGLLVWINLVTRMTLFAAAWTATVAPRTDVVSVPVAVAVRDRVSGRRRAVGSGGGPAVEG
jgi:membrane protein